MKKGFVALLLVLAIVVLVSPGIIGRLAERSMDENLDRAANESDEVTVTSQGFDRGWFSSEGQHRIEVRDGELRNALLGFTDDGDVKQLPVLIIDTRLDHGIVPITSMARDKGSLIPGLGSAVSTLSLEFEDGNKVDLPGTIFSQVSLTGDLQSNFVLESGSFSQDGETANWGDADILITTSPEDSDVGFSGTIASLAFVSIDDDFSVDTIEFSGNKRQTRFGFSVGDATLSVAAARLASATGAEVVGPFMIDSEAELDDDRVSGHTKVALDNLPFGDLGRADIILDVTLADMDGASLGNLSRALDSVDDYASGDDMMLAVEADLQRLLASGFELDLDRLDVALPQGTLETKLHMKLAATDLDRFTWTSALLALDATLDVSMPAELVDIATATDPQLNAAVGMGFLRKNGDVYEMEAQFEKGLLTVNGAPMSIPLPGIQ